MSSRLLAISIHALLAESDLLGDVWACRWPDISIHALLAESDHQEWSGSQHAPDFYPRSPCGERLCTSISITSNFEFLSTLSLRRATVRKGTAGRINGNFYPRSPCGERREPEAIREDPNAYFYPRSPCGERLLQS